jgi:UDP-glucose 4-epimerase
MHFVITGVAGFIGSSLAQHLVTAGHTVDGVDNLVCGHVSNLAWSTDVSGFAFHNMDAHDDRVLGFLRRETIVVHLGAISALPTNQSNPYRSYVNNVASTAGLLEHCRRVGVAHFIFASTSAVYENNHEYPLNEDMVVTPNLIYSLGKKQAEEIVESFGSVYGLPFTTLRFFNVYGPNMDKERAHPPLVAYLLRCVERGETPMLHSDGTQQRNYLYIRDLLDFFDVLFAAGPQGLAFNVCGKDVVSVIRIVEVVGGALGTTITPTYRDPALLWESVGELWSGALTFPRERMVEEVTKYCDGSGELAELVLGWKPKYDLAAGIRDMVTSFGTNLCRTE